MRIKAGVKIKGLQPEIILGLIMAEAVYKNHGFEAIVTSAKDGRHGPGSLHYKGQAIDLRTRHLPFGLDETIARDLRERLGDDFDVLAEKDDPQTGKVMHIHLEFDPK
jgi:hypothetical protein